MRILFTIISILLCLAQAQAGSNPYILGQVVPAAGGSCNTATPFLSMCIAGTDRSVYRADGAAGASYTPGSLFTPSESITVCRVSVDLKIAGGDPTSKNYHIAIYGINSSTNAKESVLGVSDSVSGSTLTSSFQTFVFTFATPVSLTGSTKYGVAVVQEGNQDATNYVFPRMSGGCETGGIAGIGFWRLDTSAWSSGYTGGISIEICTQ